MAKFLSATVLLLLLEACSHSDRTIPSAETTRTFQLPFVLQQQAKDSCEFHKAEAMEEVWYTFVGKYRFTDTLHLENDLRDTTLKGNFYREYMLPLRNGELTTDGLQLIADYKTTIFHKEDYHNKPRYYYPLYVVNETSRTKAFMAKDGYVFGIQEAMDTTESFRWRPIEGRGFDVCGNGRFGVKMLPGEFVLLLIPKYEGEETGLMRVRLEIGEFAYLSQSFKGTFSSKQFNVKKDSWHYDFLERDKASAIGGVFYGAIPKGYD